MLISLSRVIKPVGGYTTESVTLSATPDLRTDYGYLPIQLAGTNLHIYCLVNRGTLCVNNLPRVVVERSGRDSNLRPLGCKSDTLTTPSPRYMRGHYKMMRKSVCPSVCRMVHLTDFVPKGKNEKCRKHQNCREGCPPADNNVHQFQGQRSRSPGKLMPELPTQRG